MSLGYFDWLCDIVVGQRSTRCLHTKLLNTLFSTEFIFDPMDSSRADDGVYMRYHYEHKTNDICDIQGEPCNVLEMMIALALKMDQVMFNANFGDRVPTWFWGMISSLGLGEFTDDNFDAFRVSSILSRFLHRDYSSDGAGGLFTIPNCEYDMPRYEIWYQMYWYLGTIE